MLCLIKIQPNLVMNWMIKASLHVTDVNTNYEKGLQGEKEKWRDFCIDLISCNFSMIFAHFQTKREAKKGGHY